MTPLESLTAFVNQVSSHPEWQAALDGMLKQVAALQNEPVDPLWGVRPAVSNYNTKRFQPVLVPYNDASSTFHSTFGENANAKVKQVLGMLRGVQSDESKVKPIYDRLRQMCVDHWPLYNVLREGEFRVAAQNFSTPISAEASRRIMANSTNIPIITYGSEYSKIPNSDAASVAAGYRTLRARLKILDESVDDLSAQPCVAGRVHIDRRYGDALAALAQIDPGNAAMRDWIAARRADVAAFLAPIAQARADVLALIGNG